MKVSAIPQNTPYKAETEIYQLKGAAQLKEFARDCVTAARNSALLGQLIVPPSLLVAISPGCGLSTAIHLTAQLLDEADLVEFTGSEPIVEFKLDMPDQGGAHFPSFERLQDILYSKAAHKNNFGGLLSVDIGDWLGCHEDVRFVRFLHFVRDNTDKIFFVFTVPDGEPGIEAMAGAISRFVRLRTISLPVPEAEDLVDYIAEHLAVVNLKLDDEAEHLLYDMLSSLRTYENFGGFKTLNTLTEDIKFALVSNPQWDSTAEVSAQQLEHFRNGGDWFSIQTASLQARTPIGFTGGDDNDRA